MGRIRRNRQTRLKLGGPGNWPGDDHHFLEPRAPVSDSGDDLGTPVLRRLVRFLLGFGATLALVAAVVVLAFSSVGFAS